MVGLAIRLGVPIQTVLDMPESHVVDLLAYLNLEAKERDH